MKRALLALFVAACPPPAQQPSYFSQQPQQQPYGQQPQPYGQPPQQQPQPAPQPAPEQPAGIGGAIASSQVASCTDTLTCYGKCSPLTMDCITACDAHANPTAANIAHSALQCIAQSGCTDQNCVVGKCATELTACTNVKLDANVAAAPPPAPAAPQGGGQIDLVYQVPANWQQAKLIPNAVSLQFDHEDFYNHTHYRIHIFPSRPRSGSLVDTFNALWAEMVTPEFKLGRPVAPYRARLSSGYGVIMDADGSTITSNNNWILVGLYIIYTKDRYVPILTTGLDYQAEPALAAFLAGASIQGGAPSKEPMFSAAEIAGHWNTQSASIASYVNSSGGYVGDASIAIGDRKWLEANGTFTSQFVASRSSGTYHDKGEGRWRVDDDILVMVDKGGKEQRYRIWAKGTAQSGKADSLCMANTGTSQPRFTQPSDSINSSWFGKE